MPKIGDIVNQLKDVKHCFIPENLINTKSNGPNGELTIGVDAETAYQLALGGKVAGVLIIFDRDEYNEAFNNLNVKEG